MNPYEIWFAVFAVIGVGVVAPVWVHFVEAYLTQSPALQFLSTALLPFTALLLVASWLEPR